MRRRYPAILGLVALLAGPAHADTLLIEGLDSARQSAGERPGRGLSMSQVEKRWGAPANKEGPVGQPPITRWTYADFVVIFEYDHVVHAVLRRS